MKRFLIGALAALTLSFGSFAAEKETFVFDVAGSDTLRLDLYRADVSEAAPAVIFAFGGSFKHGKRDAEKYLPFFHFLADNGINVVSTDYRTMLAKADPDELDGVEAFAEALVGAIQVASLDYTKATAFVVENAAKWNIDPAKIFAAGSSAGAITVLQTQFEIYNRKNRVGALPEGFRYAGAISMAGAIFNGGTPRWRNTPCPMMFFHGDADSTVPFERATVGSYGLWGTKALVESLDELKVANTFWKVEGKDHVVAESPLTQNCGAVLDFIHSVVEGRATTTKVVERLPDQPAYNSTFTLEDYLRSNLQ